MIAKLNSKKFLFSSTLALGVLTGVGIAAAPAQAGTLAWENGTSAFSDLFTPSVPPGPPAAGGSTDIDAGNVIVPETFSVTFSPDNIALISGASGEFLSDFVQAPPPYALNTLTPAVGEFDFLEWEAPVGSDPYNGFEYELDGNLEFDYGNGTTVSILSGAVFLGEIDVTSAGDPAGVEFDLISGDFEVVTGGNTYTVGGDIFEVTGETFGFEEAFGSDVGGTYEGEVVVRETTPEPASILGLLAVGGLGMAMKRKKQS